MLRSLYVMLDYHMAATDGELGRVQDFLFDDESWIVHYLVADTNRRGNGGRVLIIPFALGLPEWERKQLPVLLTRDQILSSPPLDFDSPISTQQKSGHKEPGCHLRSMREVFGYSLYAADGEVGTIEDFIVDDTLWGVHLVVVRLKTDSGRSILVAPEAIRSMSWHAKAAWVNVPLREVEKGPDFKPDAPVNRDVEHQLYDYYGRPVLRSQTAISEGRSETRQR